MTTEEAQTQMPAEESEEEKSETSEEEKKKVDADPTTSPLIDEAKETIKQLREEREKMAIERRKMEKVSSDLTMQGRGLMTKSAPREETPQEYKDRIMRGGE